MFRRLVALLLIHRLTRAARLLRKHGVDFWADWLEGDIARLQREGPSAVTHLCTAFGGMGSLTDVWIDPRNGHRIAAADIERVNARLKVLTGQVYTLAKYLRPHSPHGGT